MIETTSEPEMRDELIKAPVASCAAYTLHKHLDVWAFWADAVEDPSLAQLDQKRRAAFLAGIPTNYRDGGGRRKTSKPVSCSDSSHWR